MIITNGNGRQFFVRTVLQGDRYGLNECLTHDKDRPLVEFYDYTYANQKTFGPRGQFVARYYVSTLLKDHRPGTGLCLDGGIPEWNVDAAPYSVVVALLTPLLPKTVSASDQADAALAAAGIQVEE
jgi:hypothetical protein